MSNSNNLNVHQILQIIYSNAKLGRTNLKYNIKVANLYLESIDYNSIHLTNGFIQSKMFIHYLWCLVVLDIEPAQIHLPNLMLIHESLIYRHNRSRVFVKYNPQNIESILQQLHQIVADIYIRSDNINLLPPTQKAFALNCLDYWRGKYYPEDSISGTGTQGSDYSDRILTPSSWTHQVFCILLYSIYSYQLYFEY